MLLEGEQQCLEVLWFVRGPDATSWRLFGRSTRLRPRRTDSVSFGVTFAAQPSENGFGSWHVVSAGFILKYPLVYVGDPEEDSHGVVDDSGRVVLQSEPLPAHLGEHFLSSLCFTEWQSRHSNWRFSGSYRSFGCVDQGLMWSRSIFPSVVPQRMQR